MTAYKHLLIPNYVAGGGGGGTPPSVTGVATVDGASASTLVFTKPGGVSSGDELYVAVTYYDTSASVTPPTGFSAVGSEVVDGSTYMSVWKKSAGGAEPSTYTFTLGGARYRHGGFISADGAATTAHATGQTTRTADGNDVFLSGLTTTVDDCLLICFGSTYDNAFASDTTEGAWAREYTTDGSWAGGYSRTETSSGTFGDVDTGTNETNSYVTRTIALEPV